MLASGCVAGHLEALGIEDLQAYWLQILLGLGPWFGGLRVSGL